MFNSILNRLFSLNIKNMKYIRNIIIGLLIAVGASSGLFGVNLYELEKLQGDLEKMQMAVLTLEEKRQEQEQFADTLAADADRMYAKLIQAPFATIDLLSDIKIVKEKSIKLSLTIEDSIAEIDNLLDQAEELRAGLKQFPGKMNEVMETIHDGVVKMKTLSELKHLAFKFVIFGLESLESMFEKEDL